jgi:hypothetical protein
MPPCQANAAIKTNLGFGLISKHPREDKAVNAPTQTVGYRFMGSDLEQISDTLVNIEFKRGNDKN